MSVENLLPWWMAKLLLILALAASQKGVGGKAAPAFNANDYPAGTFEVTNQTETRGHVKITVIDARKTRSDGRRPSYCRAWLDVERGGQLQQRFYYSDIEPAGYKYGVFVPKRQPLPEYFIAAKLGDYDGKTLMVSNQGVVTELPGGSFLVTADKRFLISEYVSDAPAIVVYDLSRRKILAKTNDFSGSQEWYVDAQGYFYREPEDTASIVRLDLVKGQFVKRPASSVKLQTARAVRRDFDPRDKQDCFAQPQ